MDITDLLEKYQAFRDENAVLKQEIAALKAKLGIPETVCVDRHYTPLEKIRLFMALFKGRDDVFARRWENRQGRAGYSPACLHEWLPGLCQKPVVKCAECQHRSLAPLDEKVIEGHLRGNIVIGLYPLLLDETCHFLAIDFDESGWEKDIETLRAVCTAFEIPISVERSRSGTGAHAWFFFSTSVPAGIARRFGSALLTHAMSQRHEIAFGSYDRFFPNQDTMPKGGFGNLIALPLQKKARDKGNSVFIDENFRPYEDQWGYLAQIRKLSPDELEPLIRKLCKGNDLGTLKEDHEDDVKPWEVKRSSLSRDDFPSTATIVRANMLYIEKAGISQKALNALKRLAAFKNPEFYRAQAMRLPTYNKPRIIACTDETPEYLCLPRGCDEDVIGLLDEGGTDVVWSDKTNAGRAIKVSFKGILRNDQQLALTELLKYDQGVLAATTAFGKTVIAAKIIAESKTNTLVLTHRRQLLAQWSLKLVEFLDIDETLPEVENRKRRKHSSSLIGQIGAGKDSPRGIIDIALMQSLGSGGVIKEFVRDYGMVIVDECHHVPAFSFEQIMKHVYAKYVYGLTATPDRQDGHHPIIFMQCGPVRYRVDAKKQAEERSFDHYVIPRFTSMRVPFAEYEKTLSIQEVYAHIVKDETRNQLIVDDVISNHQHGRHSLILTERTTHVETLARMLGKTIPDVIILTGGRGMKETRTSLARISTIPVEKPLTLIATGKYIGEGFDEPRLDTLFLAMPIAWKGTLHQYAGRLHRSFEHKPEVRIYDYVDIHVKMLERMYHKRLTGYASMGYRTKAEGQSPESMDIIFDHHSFLPVFRNDIFSAGREIMIVSPYVTKPRVLQMFEILSAVLEKQIMVTVVTRPTTDYRDKDRPGIEEILGVLQKGGVQMVFKPNFHQKFAVIDQRIVWYGSMNLLSFGRAEESMMRLTSPNIAYELSTTIKGG